MSLMDLLVDLISRLWLRSLALDVGHLFKVQSFCENSIIKNDMIDALYRHVENGSDDKGIIRDGVSESQFNQVLNIELDQIVKAFQCLDRGGTNIPKFTVIVAQKNHHTKLFQANAPDNGNIPKFTVIVAQKNHHTKLFQANSPDNVPPGTVVDSQTVHPRNLLVPLLKIKKSHSFSVLCIPKEYYSNLHCDYMRYAHLAAAQMGQS